MSNSTKRYYEKHKERIKARHKYLYQNDPDYRKNQKKRVAEYKKRKAEEKNRLKEKLVLERKVWRNLNVGGTITPCCKIGYLAASINRCSQTVRLWETEGKLPKTITLKGIRYYTKPHYQLIVRCFTPLIKVTIPTEKQLQKFFLEVRRLWNSKIK